MPDRPQTDAVQAQALGNAASVADTIRNQLGGVLKRAYKDLNQDVLSINSQQAGQDIGGVRGIPSDVFNSNLSGQIGSLASNFATDYVNKTGKAPTPDQISSFVSSAYTPAVARGLIEGSISDSSIRGLSSSYIQENPDIATAPDSAPQQSPVADLRGKYDELFKRLQGQGIEAINTELDESYRPVRKRIVEERAALGNLRDPSTQKVLGDSDVALEGQRGKSLSDFIRGLTTQQISSETDIAKTLENIRMGESAAKTQASQFAQNLGLQKRSLANQEEQQFQDNSNAQKEFDLSAMLGKMQADAAKPGAFDRAIQVVSALGGAASGLGAGYGAWQDYKASRAKRKAG